MRFVLCDDDRVFTSIIEAMLNDLGHEVVGVGRTTADSVALVQAARPDVVIMDLSLGFNSDFDVVETASGLGAFPIIFTQSADDAILAQYKVRPTVVFKPDLPELGRVVQRLEVDNRRQVVSHERRQRPARAAGGPPPSLTDAQAFYEVLNGVTPGDGLMSMEVPGDGQAAADAASRVRAVMRDADRLMASGSVLRVILPAAADGGVASFRARLDEVNALPPGTTIRSVVVAPDETPADAFDRLKAAGPEPYGPKIERSPAVAPPSTDHSAPVT